MAAQSRPADLDVAEPVLREALADHPGSFDFFQAVRLLELTAPNGSSIRFHANPFLDFPPSQLESLNVDRSGAVDVTANFLGLVGPQGVLPYFYSELVQDRLRAKDKTLAAFLDIFHHRLISLFYQAWQKHRFPVPWERGEADEVSSALLALLRDPQPRVEESSERPRPDADVLHRFAGHRVAAGLRAPAVAERPLWCPGRDRGIRRGLVRAA